MGEGTHRFFTKIPDIAGVGNLFITVDCTGYSFLVEGSRKKLVMPWTVSEIAFL
jgi:hypothetical protein